MSLRNRQSPIVNRKSEQGIALVITLILLSVTLVMAIAFLAISRRETGSVTTSTDTVTARLAADAALANAQAQIIASVLATSESLQFRPARLDQFHQREWFCERQSPIQRMLIITL